MHVAKGARAGVNKKRNNSGGLRHLSGPFFAFVGHAHVDEADGLTAGIVVTVVYVLEFHIEMTHLFRDADRVVL